MSDMKCPVCQDYLIPCIKNQNDWIYHCDNQKCPMYDDADNENAKHLLASKELWQALTDSMKEHDLCHDALVKRTEEVNRTRKALKIAWDGLEKIGSGDIIEHSVVGHEDDNKSLLPTKP